jgi:hypothetical protein
MSRVFQTLVDHLAVEDGHVDLGLLDRLTTGAAPIDSAAHFLRVKEDRMPPVDCDPTLVIGFSQRAFGERLYLGHRFIRLSRYIWHSFRFLRTGNHG